MRRKHDPQDHVSLHAVPLRTTLQTIGVVHSPYRERFGTPRQPVVTAQTLGDQRQEGSIELFPDVVPERALEGLAQFERIWVIALLHLNRHWNPMVVPPRGPKTKQGVLATRAPHRPNPIGLSALELTGIDGRFIRVRGIDLLEGTPVLDIKPYVPYADAFSDSRAGWLDALDEAMDGPDRWPDSGETP